MLNLITSVYKLQRLLLSSRKNCVFEKLTTFNGPFGLKEGKEGEYSRVSLKLAYFKSILLYSLLFFLSLSLSPQFKQTLTEFME